MNQRVYELLKQTAKSNNIIFYSELNKICELGLDFNRNKDRKRLGQILGEISRYEHSRQHPLLSVVAVYMGEQIPADSFFNLAQELGVMNADESNLEFFSRHLTETLEYWRRNADSA